jgi:hypothetical protein
MRLQCVLCRRVEFDHSVSIVLCWFTQSIQWMLIQSVTCLCANLALDSHSLLSASRCALSHACLECFDDASRTLCASSTMTISDVWPRTTLYDMADLHEWLFCSYSSSHCDYYCLIIVNIHRDISTLHRMLCRTSRTLDRTMIYDLVYTIVAKTQWWWMSRHCIECFVVHLVYLIIQWYMIWCAPLLLKRNGCLDIASNALSYISYTRSYIIVRSSVRHCC